MTREEAKDMFNLSNYTASYGRECVNKIFDNFEQQLKETDKELEEYRHSWKCEVDDLEQQLKERDRQLASAQIKASAEVMSENIDLKGINEYLKGRIVDLQEILSWKTEVINNFDKERKELKAKLKRYENPIFDFTGIVYEDTYLRFSDIDGIKLKEAYRVIVLEGGE